MKAARIAARLNARELAAELQLDESMVSKIESEKASITPAVYQQLVEALPTLKDPVFVEAIGYPVRVPRVHRVIPPKILALMDQLNDEDWATVLRLVRGLRVTAEDRPEQAQ